MRNCYMKILMWSFSDPPLLLLHLGFRLGAQNPGTKYLSSLPSHGRPTIDEGFLHVCVFSTVYEDKLPNILPLSSSEVNARESRSQFYWSPSRPNRIMRVFELFQNDLSHFRVFFSKLLMFLFFSLYQVEWWLSKKCIRMIFKKKMIAKTRILKVSKIFVLYIKVINYYQS